MFMITLFYQLLNAQIKSHRDYLCFSECTFAFIRTFKRIKLEIQPKYKSRTRTSWAPICYPATFFLFRIGWGSIKDMVRKICGPIVENCTPRLDFFKSAPITLIFVSPNNEHHKRITNLPLVSLKNDLNDQPRLKPCKE